MVTIDFINKARGKSCQLSAISCQLWR